MAEALKMKKAELLSQLKAKLPVAAAFDKAQLAEHRAECSKVAKARREYLREVIKLPDAKLGELTIGRYDDTKWPSSASCPSSMVSRYESHIRDLSIDMRNVITLKQNSRYDSLYFLLTWTPDATNDTVCA